MMERSSVGSTDGSAEGAGSLEIGSSEDEGADNCSKDGSDEGSAEAGSDEAGSSLTAIGSEEGGGSLLEGSGTIGAGGV